VIESMSLLAHMRPSPLYVVRFEAHNGLHRSPSTALVTKRSEDKGGGASAHNFTVVQQQP